MALPKTTILEELEQRGHERGMAEGRAEGARSLLLRMLELRFGPLATATRQRVEAISSVEELERLGERVLTATSLREVDPQF